MKNHRKGRDEDLSAQVAAALLDRELRVLDIFKVEETPASEMSDAGSLPLNYEAEIDGSLVRVLVRRCY